MMAEKLYLRPLGLLYGAAARAAAEQGAAGPLVGGAIAFSFIEIIQGAPGRATRELRAYGDLMGSGESALREGLARLTAPRPAVAGLAFDRPLLMGVVNVTPDSFSDGGLFNTTEDAITHAAILANAGADIVDIGGESTRPGADPLTDEDELARVRPVLEGLRGLDARISVDTRKAAVMTAAAQTGAHLLNDVSALTYDRDGLDAAARTGLPVILMHAQGDPKTMQDKPVYDDVVLEVYDFLEARLAACVAAGIPREKLIADPGIGFGKTVAHNMALLSSLTLLHGLGVPVCLGASRKSTIGALTGERDPLKRSYGSVAAALAGAAQGVQIIRVHDVAETRQALAVWGPAISGDAPS